MKTLCKWFFLALAAAGLLIGCAAHCRCGMKQKAVDVEYEDVDPAYNPWLSDAGVAIRPDEIVDLDGGAPFLVVDLDSGLYRGN